MREIKFRAWDYQGETMLYSEKREHERYEETDYIFQITHNGLELITLQMTDKCEDGEHVQRMEYLPTECELMQYTGLKDKNGVEIYEGDIVSGREEERCEGYLCNVNTWIGECRYDNDKKRLMWFDLYEGVSYEIDDYMFDLVIGNIHENPELLEVK